MYYRLLAKKGDFHDDKTCSTMFLQAINDYAYSDLITTLVSPGPCVLWVLRISSTNLPSSAPSWYSRGPTVSLASQTPGSLTSPSKAPHQLT